MVSLFNYLTGFVVALILKPKDTLSQAFSYSDLAVTANHMSSPVTQYKLVEV